MTPKNRTLEGKYGTLGGRVKNDPKKSDIIYGCSLELCDNKTFKVQLQNYLISYQKILQIIALIEIRVVRLLSLCTCVLTRYILRFRLSRYTLIFRHSSFNAIFWFWKKLR